MGKSEACPYCPAAAAQQVELRTFKHRWTRCTACGTMRRENRAVYPGEAMQAWLSGTAFGKRLADSIFKPFMRRRERERTDYSTYGNEYDWVFSTQPESDPFRAMKRARYLGEAKEIVDLFARNGVDLSTKSILDLSGGPGSFAQLIRDKVARISVTEYDQGSVTGMQSRVPGVRMFQADLNEDWEDAEEFDAVLYRSCVYFCMDLERHISQIKARVRSGGHIFVNTNMPTMGNMLRWQYEDYTLKVLYPPALLRNILERQGFRIVESGVTPYYTHYLQWFSWRTAVYHLWGIWNVLRPGAPPGLDARASWVLAVKAAPNA